MIAAIAYAARTDYRPRFHANDHSRDTVVIAPQEMTLTNGRAAVPGLDIEGFRLVPHVSRVADFREAGEVAADHPAEIEALLLAETGADVVVVTGPGVLRFSERSQQAGTLNNSYPARFAHVDVSDATAAMFAARSAPQGRAFTRAAAYNVWRTFSGAPQDVPLAVCDARSVDAADLILADAVFDAADQPEWSFEAQVVAHNRAHRWHWFADMSRDEVIIFKTHDSLAGVAHCVPHVAFDSPDATPEWHPRASIEMRAIAYWFS
jgi:hypothetical protein